MNLNQRDWSLPMATTAATYSRCDTEKANSEKAVSASKRSRITIWSRLRVGMSQMFRRVAVFFRRGNRKTRTTSSSGSSSSGLYWDSMDDEVDFIDVISPLDSAILNPDTPTLTPTRGVTSKPVDIRMGPEQERLNRYRQQFRNDSSRSRRKVDYDDSY